MITQMTTSLDPSSKQTPGETNPGIPYYVLGVLGVVIVLVIIGVVVSKLSKRHRRRPGRPPREGITNRKLSLPNRYTNVLLNEEPPPSSVLAPIPIPVEPPVVPISPLSSRTHRRTAAPNTRRDDDMCEKNDGFAYCDIDNLLLGKRSNATLPRTPHPYLPDVPMAKENQPPDSLSVDDVYVLKSDSGSYLSLVYDEYDGHLIEEIGGARNIETSKDRPGQSMAPGQMMSFAPSQMVSSAPSQMVSSAPSQMVSSAPSQMVSSAPSQMVSSAPSQMVSSAPSQMVSSAPSQMVSSAPSQMVSSAPSGDGDSSSLRHPRHLGGSTSTLHKKPKPTPRTTVRKHVYANTHEQMKLLRKIRQSLSHRRSSTARNTLHRQQEEHRLAQVATAAGMRRHSNEEQSREASDEDLRRNYKMETF